MTYRSDHFTALLDACVLAGVLKRNLLPSLAEMEKRGQSPFFHFYFISNL